MKIQNAILLAALLCVSSAHGQEDAAQKARIALSYIDCDGGFLIRSGRIGLMLGGRFVADTILGATYVGTVYVWGGEDKRYAAELVALAPDVILASATPSVVALQSLTNKVPIVFVAVSDPVGAGVVESIARPGGNVTGFMNFEYSLSGKWLELLRQIEPGLARAAVLREPGNPAAIGQFSAIQAAAQSLAIELKAINVRDVAEIERALVDFARLPNGGLIVTPTAGQSLHRDLIVALAAKLKLPAVYADREVVAAGGLISYGPDRIEQFQRAADYIDRILKGEKPAELPVQAPNFELAINLQTAKALGLTMPQALQASADEVIE